MTHGDDDAGANHAGHSHTPQSFNTAFAVGVALNVALVVGQVWVGLAAHSIALLADAGHNLSDVLSLLIAWGASWLARLPPSRHFTYGFRGSSILAALANAVVLLFGMGAIAWEAVRRLGDPGPVGGVSIIIVAGIAIVINAITAWLFASGRQGDLNVRAAFVHMAADAGVSAGVVIAGILILLTDWRWLDPVASLAVVAVVLWSTWGLLRDSVGMALDAVPAGIELKEVEAFLQRQQGVAAVHDLHIWPMSTTETALTAHLVMPAGHPGDGFILDLDEKLHRQFGIGHPTVQIETDASRQCPLEPARVV